MEELILVCNKNEFGRLGKIYLNSKDLPPPHNSYSLGKNISRNLVGKKYKKIIISSLFGPSFLGFNFNSYVNISQS